MVDGPDHGQDGRHSRCLPGLRDGVRPGSRPVWAAAARQGRGRQRGDQLPGGPPVPPPAPGLPEGDRRRADQRIDQPARAPHPGGDRGAAGGPAGAGPPGRLAAGVSRRTLVRLVRAMPGPAVSSSPRMLAVDEFALRKDRRYWTLLV